VLKPWPSAAVESEDRARMHGNSLACIEELAALEANAGTELFSGLPWCVGMQASGLSTWARGGAASMPAC